MRTCRYSRMMLIGDGLRTAFGLAITLGPLVLLDVAGPLAVALGGFALVFLGFGLRLAIQSLASVALSSEGIAVHGLRSRSLAWRNLQRLELAYYAPARRRGGGWYQLTLAGPTDGGSSIRLRLESTIEGFEDIVRTALKASAARGLAFDPSTSANLAALGHPDEPGPAKPEPVLPRRQA